MRIKKSCRKGCVMGVGILLFTILLAGCQKTPDQSSIVSKEGGLDETVKSEPLKEGETQVIQMPEEFKVEETWDDDKGILKADISLQQITVGNLPIIELQRHAISEEELKELTGYFSQGETLYKGTGSSQEYYEKLIEEMKNGEGIFATPITTMYTVFPVDVIEKGKEAASKESTEREPKKEIQFSERQRDSALLAMYKQNGIMRDLPKTDEMLIYFKADVGADGEKYIEAKTYDKDAGNNSSFIYANGTSISQSTIKKYQKSHDRYRTVTETDEQWEKILNQYLEKMNQEMLTREEAVRKAEQLLSELGIEGKVCVTDEPVVWLQDREPILDDLSIDSSAPSPFAYQYLWNADLSQAESGYCLKFSNEIGGLPLNGISEIPEAIGEDEPTDLVYTPVFYPETIEIVVTASGIKRFDWENLSEEVGKIAENVKIKSLDEIKPIFLRQVQWVYPETKPKDETIVDEYIAKDISLEYSYITAYKNPDHVWAVPCWKFTANAWEYDPYEGQKAEDVRELEYQFVFDATSGAVID